MYLRTTQRRKRDGSTVRYLQLAHNEWDAKAGYSKVRVLYSFGREDELDRAAIERLIGSLARALEPGRALAATAAPELCFLDSRPIGGAYLLDGLWRRLGIDATLARLLAGRRLDPRAERVLFALVANRALEPLSKLAATTWVAERVAIPGLAEVDDDSCYRAMDFLLAVEEELAEAVYWATADLLNLEVDLLLLDTTSTYFERDEAEADLTDADGNVIRPAFRVHGKSKDHRGDLPQVVVALAVTRTGIPIRVWTFPGNASDQELIRQVKDDLRAWRLVRVVWVADRGFCSQQNRRYLQRAGGHYILGEKLRSDSKEARAALARQGRYHTVAGNLRVKEVVIDDGTMRDRFVVCHNPLEAERDKTVREQILTQLEEQIAGSHALPQQKRHDLACRLEAKPGYRRFLRRTKAGLLRIDRAAVAAEERLDGASSCSAPPTQPSQPRTSRSATSNCSRSSAPGATSRPRSSCAPSTTASRSGSAPTCCSAGSRSCSSGSPRTQPATPGATSATSSNGCTSVPSPAPPAPAANAPSSPPGRRRSCARSPSPSRPASSTSNRPPNPPEPASAIDTRPLPPPRGLSPAQKPNPVSVQSPAQVSAGSGSPRA
jgi:Transposase DDE domain